LAGSTEYTSDLSSLLLEEEDELRATFGRRKLLAYHCTRLLPHELEDIRGGGLRLLDQALVHDRIVAAVEHGSLPSSARVHTLRPGTYTRSTTSSGARTKSASSSGGRRWTRTPPAATRYWRIGAGRRSAAARNAPLLGEVGTLTIVAARLDFTSSWRHSTTRPALTKLFVGRLLGTERCSADVLYRDLVPPEDIIAFWQPGHSEYDRHCGLPR